MRIGGYAQQSVCVVENNEKQDTGDYTHCEHKDFIDRIKTGYRFAPAKAMMYLANNDPLSTLYIVKMGQTGSSKEEQQKKKQTYSWKDVEDQRTEHTAHLYKKTNKSRPLNVHEKYS